MLTYRICSSFLLQLLSYSSLPLLLRERRLVPLYVYLLTSSSSREPDPQIHRRKQPSRTPPRKKPASRQALRSALRSRSALAPQDRLSSAAMRPSILRASLDISSCATRAPEKHATKESMARARSEEQCCYTRKPESCG